MQLKDVYVISVAMKIKYIFARSYTFTFQKLDPPLTKEKKFTLLGDVTY